MKKTFFILMMVMFIQTLSAQEYNPKYKYWFNIGLGINNSSVANIGGNYNFSFFKDYYFQVGYQFISRDLGLPYSYLFYKEFPLYAVNIGIGYITKNRSILFGNFIGPSYVWGERLGENKDVFGHRQIEKFYTAGIAINSQLFFKPLPELGLGLELYGNINFVRTMAEIKVSIHFNNLL